MSLPPRRQGARLSDHEKRILQLKWLDVYVVKHTATTACDAAGISLATFHYWVDNDPEFGAKYYEAEQRINDAIEEEIDRRGRQGWEEPVFQQGVQVGVIRRYSDTLLLARAKSRMRKYNDKLAITAGDSADDTSYADVVLGDIGLLAERIRNAQLAGLPIDADFVQVDTPGDGDEGPDVEIHDADPA